MVQVGIMHGRLSPPLNGRFQAFPAESWQDEFYRARDAGLACIEWIYEVPNETRNPLRDVEGVVEIKRLIGETGVEVRSVCADYFMDAHLVKEDGAIDQDNVAVLRHLIGQASLLGATYIVLPFVDSSRITSDLHESGVVELLRAMGPEAAEADVELHLETDLEPQAFASLMARVQHPNVKVNYDIGNSSSLGYDPNEELQAYGDRLGSVHIKDRIRGGVTQPLTTGDADFASCFAQFRRIGFNRWFILQAARGEEGDEVRLAATNRGMVEEWARTAGLG
jgi:L-ribulose-5-phosphate 3-epimerase